MKLIFFGRNGQYAKYEQSKQKKQPNNPPSLDKCTSRIFGGDQCYLEIKYLPLLKIMSAFNDWNRESKKNTRT